MSSDSQQHQLSLKVMRLSKPNFASSNAIFHDVSGTSLALGDDGFAKLRDKNLSNFTATPSTKKSSVNTPAILDISDLPASKGPEHENLEVSTFSLSDLLLLPSSFGNIYLGETFSAYICINNDSASGVRNLYFRAELQTTTQKFLLHDTTEESHHGLLANQTAEFMVNHEIRELGTHILVCSINYVSSGEEKRSFRRFYKFNVLNPLAVRTKVNSVGTGHLYLEAQIQNQMAIPMFIERLKLEPSEYFACEDLNHYGADSVSVFGDFVSMQPQDIRQYLFRLRPRSDQSTINAIASTNLGRLDILWRSNLGEIGRLQTNQLVRKAAPSELVDIKIIDCPKNIVVEVPFVLTFDVKNLSRQNANLKLISQKEKMGTIWFLDEANTPLGELRPEESRRVQLKFFPSAPGCHKIEGIRVCDELSNETKDLQALAEVFVHRREQ